MSFRRKLTATVIVLFCTAVFRGTLTVYDVASASAISCGISISAIAVDPKNPEVVYAINGLENVLYKSADGGDNWNAVGDAIFRTRVIIIDPKNPLTIYVGRHKSIDGGKTWHFMRKGLDETINFSKVMICPNNTEILYSLTDNNGVYKSINGGTSWTAIGDEKLGTCRALAMDPNNSNVLYGHFERKITNSLGRIKDIYGREYGITGGIYKSVDGGATWISSLPSVGITELAVAPSNSAIVYAVNRQYGVYRSLNGGNQWYRINHRLPNNAQVLNFVFDRVYPERMYARTTHGLFTGNIYSNDWSGWSSVGPESKDNVLTLAINPQNSKNIYVGTSNLGIFRTTDGGITWEGDNRGIRALPSCP